MDSAMMYRVVGIAVIVAAILSVIGTIVLLCFVAFQFSWALLFSTVGLAICAVALAACVPQAVDKIDRPKVFNNSAEKEVLTAKQRRELKRARGEVVMERALIDVEHERQNIVHRQIEAAHDPDKPPHRTTWTANPDRRREL